MVENIVAQVDSIEVDGSVTGLVTMPNKDKDRATIPYPCEKKDPKPSVKVPSYLSPASPMVLVDEAVD